MPSVVRLLLVAGAGGALLCGCVLTNPPDYDQREHSPVVIARSPVELMLALDKEDPDQNRMQFSVDVLDDDEDQILSHRWFLDYDPMSPSPRCGLYFEYLSLPSGDPVRRIATTLYAGDRVPSGECHRFTVVVTDGEWRDPQGCAEVVDGAGSAAADWWLLVYDQDHDYQDVRMAGCLGFAGEP